jgi:hypothetical protein
MTDVTRAEFEQQVPFEGVDLRVEIPGNGKLRGGFTQRAKAGQI